jgi:hypothetical protein
MTTLARLVCISTFLAGAVLPASAFARDYVPLATACPGALKTLPENLYPAWRELDSAAEVVVDFKLDGGKVSGITMTGGHGGYAALVRHAVKAMTCSQAGAQGSAVRFRITFDYPEDHPGITTAMQIADEVPALAAL